jgi:hypothetical protein
MRRHRVLGAVAGLGTLACGAGWHQPLSLAPGAWTPRQQVQVWTGGQAVRWHGVVIRTDSISGVPFLQRLDCDNCRRAVPLAEVDSVRVGHPTAGFWRSVGLTLGLTVAVVLVVCKFGRGGCVAD